MVRQQELRLSAYPGPADPSIYTVVNGNSIAMDMEAGGVSWVPAKTNLKNGWELMRRMLFSSVERDDAGFFLFETCEQFIETVPSIPRNQRDMDDVDTDCEDHIADESRYRCMTPRYGLRVEQV